jgi:hypothetical protein
METYLAKYQKPKPVAVPKQAIAQLRRYNKNPLAKKRKELAETNQAKQELSLTQARADWSQELSRLQSSPVGPGHVAARAHLLRQRLNDPNMTITPTYHM